jgi:hypothetical protein
MAIILNAEEVCQLIDNYPGILPMVAKGMKSEIRRGNCPWAVTNSLKVRAITMFEVIEDSE